MRFRFLKVILFIISFLYIASNSFAEDVAKYSGGITYTGCQSIGNTNIFLNDPNDYATIKDGYIYLPNGCGSLPQVAAKYLKISNGQVVEMSQAEQDAVDAEEAATQTLSIRSGAKNQLVGFSESPLYQRAFVQTLLDELNDLRKWTRDFKAETAASTNLSNFQTRIATLPTLNDRTLAQAKTVIENKIDQGAVDN